MKAALARFLPNCSGSTALEYAVIGSVISIALVVAAISVGTRLNALIGAIVPYLD